jgi:tetratricopeptide repeat protein
MRQNGKPNGLRFLSFIMEVQRTRMGPSSPLAHRTMPRPRRRALLVLFLGSVWAFAGFRANQTSSGDTVIHVRPSHLDESLECVRQLYKKPALTDMSLDLRSSLVPCPASVEELSARLKSAGVRLFPADDFVFLIPSKLFPPRPPDLSPYIKTLNWNTIVIVSKVEPSQDLPPTEAGEIGKQIFQRARLIPLEVSLLPAGPQQLHLQISVRLLVGKPATDGSRPVVGWINGLQAFSIGRLVYGELRDGKYKILWDSPLFDSRGLVYLKDVNGDGLPEIVIQSQDCGNSCTDEIVIFDKDGRELTRQKECDTDAQAFNEEDGVCAIRGDEISLLDTTPGISTIRVKNWSTDNKDHVFRLERDVFSASGPVGSDREPDSDLAARAASQASALNKRAMQLMQEGNYEPAARSFAEAAGLVPSSALFANNAGFAYYRLGDYEKSSTWLRKATELDPNRAVAYLNLGDALAKLNRNAEARQAYTKYLELAPNSNAAPDVKKKLEALPLAP